MLVWFSSEAAGLGPLPPSFSLTYNIVNIDYIVKD